MSAKLEFHSASTVSDTTVRIGRHIPTLEHIILILSQSVFTH
jgi:hypothetical protein